MSATGGREVWTPLQLVGWTARYFGEHGIASARLDAELLLAHVLGVRRIDLYLDFERPVSEGERERFRERVRARAQKRIPVAYLTGVREFWSRPFQVTPEVLVPRPETETLVRAGLDLAPRRVLEVGVGSGAVIGALAVELPELRAVGTERSRAALAVARSNLEALDVADRVALVCADVMRGIGGRFDLLISNPPYLTRAELESVPPEVQHEPRQALDGGEDGLDFVRQLAEQAAHRVPDGHAAIEVGAGQAAAASEILRAAGARETAVHRDLAGVERVVVARFGEEG